MLIHCHDCSHSMGARELFCGLNLTVEEGERIAIIGPNGSGKSTLLRLLSGSIAPDSGQVLRRNGLRIAMVAQSEADNDTRSVAACIAQGIGDCSPHEREAITDRYLRMGGFRDPSFPAGQLSGGWRKRLAIVSALAQEPDLLLLDEPTNHLDLSSCLWLEALLGKTRASWIVISHDRWFISRTAQRILEINPRFPGAAFSCHTASGGYDAFLEQRQIFVEGLLAQQAAMNNNFRREKEWLSRQPKARTTKNVARIRRAGDLAANLEQVSQLNRQERSVEIAFQASGRRSQDLLIGKAMTLSRGGRCLFRDLDISVGPGCCLGILGGNGSGKSSLLAALAGELALDSGQVKTAQDLRVVTFDQTRSSLDRSRSIARSLAPQGDSVVIGDRCIPVQAWAARFLFPPHVLDQRVEQCSGGEQARLLIAQLMSQPADLLVLDEPSNDLDIASLEVLESAIADFSGGVLLVTHDRWMLDHLCSDLIALQGNGDWRRVGSYEQWERQEQEAAEKKLNSRDSADQQQPQSQAQSFAINKELRNIEARIEKAEAALAALSQSLDDPAVACDPEALLALSEKIRLAQERVDSLYARWEELSDLSW